MSAASRARELARFDLYQRRGFPTWNALRAWQRGQLANWCEVVNLADPWRAQFEGALEPMTYPAPFELDIAPPLLQPVHS